MACTEKFISTSTLNKNNAQVDGNINKSLLSLSKCFTSLAEAYQKQSSNAFIPWRESKLTRLLKVIYLILYVKKESLTGQARLIMFANISPSVKDIDETLKTLHYATMARGIKNIWRKNNTIEIEHGLNKYDEVISSLTNEVDKLKAQLAVKTHNQHLISSFIFNLLENNKSSIYTKFERIQKDITNHFEEEIKLKKEIKADELKLYFSKINTLDGNNVAIKKEHGIRGHLHFNDLNKKNKVILINQELIKLALQEKKLAYTNLQKNRENLLMQISHIKDDLLSDFLKLNYEHYKIEIENIDYDKQSDRNELNVKDIQIKKFVEQIKLRDNQISKSILELKKKNLILKPNDKYKNLEDINIKNLVDPEQMLEEYRIVKTEPVEKPILRKLSHSTILIKFIKEYLILNFMENTKKILLILV